MWNDGKKYRFYINCGKITLDTISPTKYNRVWGDFPTKYNRVRGDFPAKNVKFA